LGSHFLLEKYDFDSLLNLVLTINVAENIHERGIKVPSYTKLRI